MVSTRSKTGAAPARSPLKTISKKRHPKATGSPRLARGAPTPFPDLSLHSDSGSVISTHSLLSDAAPGLILFTYPRANTGGCTTQAKGLSALREPALAAGYNIVGCSYDSVKSQASWKVKSSIPLMLLSDTPSVGLLRKLSVHKPPRGVKRSVFVITRQGDSLHIVLAKRAVSPKDCIALIQQYIKDNPLKPASANADADHAMTDEKPQAEPKPPASEPADPDMTDVAAEKPHEKPPAEHPQTTDQPQEANQTANHANAEPPAAKADAPPEQAQKETVPAEPAEPAAPAEPATEKTNHKPADAPQPQPDATAKETTAAVQAQPTTDKKPDDNASSKDQKDTTEAKPEEKREEKPEEKSDTANKEKPVVMDVEKPQVESDV